MIVMERIVTEPELSFKVPASRLELAAAGVVVRPLTIEDAPAIADAVAESLIELKRFMPWAHFPQTAATQRERLVGVSAAYWRGEDYGFGAFAAADGRFLGGSGLHRRTLNPKGLELGYWMRTGAAGRGLCTQISQALVAYAFCGLGAERVQVGHNEANAASARVIAKCGFLYEGSLRCFEPSPTPEMRADGYAGTAAMRLYGLCREDLGSLAWLPATLKDLRVFDWRGHIVRLDY
jgi:RimJ/RimL family protein N-acetyltransferase